MNLGSFLFMGLGSVHVLPAPFLSPDFYAVTDWSNPAANHQPEWHNVICIGSRLYAHPTVLEKITESKVQNNGE